MRKIAFPKLALVLCGFLAASCAVSCAGLSLSTDGPHQATGLKVGEVTSTSAVVWTRGTQKKEKGLREAEYADYFRIGGWEKSKSSGSGEDMAMVPGGGDEQFLLENEGGAVTGRVEGEKVKGDSSVVVGFIKGKTPVNLKQGVLKAQAVRGSSGKVEVTYHPAGRPDAAKKTPRLPFRRGRDFTRQFFLGDLAPDTAYEVTVNCFRGDESEPTSTRQASFRTAPAPGSDRPVRFTVVTGQAYRTMDDRVSEVLSSVVNSEFEQAERSVKGHRIYREMMTLQPDFMVHTGDVVYYDHQGSPARSPGTARIWWQRMFSLRNMIDFHEEVPVYYMKDDHDTLKNDCWPGQRNRWLSYSEGRAIFHEQTPVSLEADLSINGGKPYRTVRWGRHLQIWMLEVRDYRDSNEKDYDNPNKTMLGKEQIQWLEETLGASDATFRMVICPGPVVGPDRPEEPGEEEMEHFINKRRPPRTDNLANPAWHIERENLLRLFEKHKNLILVVGDRHWKYHSAWPNKSNPRIHELSCGSVSDEHARSGLRMIGVPRPSEDETLVWRDEVEQGGFLSVEVGPGPTAVARFHKVDGSMAYPVNSAGRREVVFRANGSATYRRF